MFPYLSLAVYVVLSFIVGFFTSSFHLSGWLLHGLHSYVSPENKPSTQEEQGGNDYRSVKGQGPYKDNEAENASVLLRKREKKKKEKSKDKSVWEEGNSQIFRVNLSYSQFSGRLYYPEFDEAVVYSMVGLANLLAHECLHYFAPSESGEYTKTINYEIIPFLMGLFVVFKLVWTLARVSCKSHTSRTSELILSFIVGSVGFLVVLYMLFASQNILAFENIFSPTGNLDATGIDPGLRILLGVMLASVAGFLSGVFVSPAHQNVRSFWLGTDQLQWNMPVMKWSTIPSLLLHANVVLPLFMSFLWIKSLGEFFIISDTTKQATAPYTTKGIMVWGKMILPAPSEDWAQDFGISRDAFIRTQTAGLLLTGLLQICLFRVNVQSYLNEAVFVWYEGLHRSKVVNMELTRAKVLLNNYFLCRAAAHFFVPGMLVILLLGTSRVCPVSSLAATSQALLLLRTAAHFLAWWGTFSLSIISCVILGLYRLGFLLAS